MQALTFKRGVHPPDGKELAKDQPIKVIMPKENSELFYPMSQHIGAPCDPLVAVGDHVKVGQKIAESGAFMSSPIFASVSGEVVDIRPMLVPGEMCIRDRVCNGNTPRSHCKYFSLTARLTVDSWILSCSAISTRRKGTSCPCGSEKKSLCFSTMASTTCCKVDVYKRQLSFLYPPYLNPYFSVGLFLRAKGFLQPRHPNHRIPCHK